MSNKIKSISLEAISRFTKAFPLTLSICVCTGMGSLAGVIFAFIAAFLCGETEQKKFMSVYTSFLIAVFTFKSYGPGALSVAIISGGILLIISSFAYDKIKKLLCSPAVPSAMLATALCVTVLFTTDYFGIGAVGKTPREMIASYLSLGFHPNWRGVLYGTIVMVIMITFPRKFKKLSKILNASFLGLTATLLLNLWLNPPDMISAVKEVGAFSFADFKGNLIFPIVHQPSFILNGIVCGVALFITVFCCVSENAQNKNDYLISGAANTALGLITCAYLPSTAKPKKALSGLLAAIFTALFSVIFKDFIARIPVHSCAVVLIVGAWNSIKWSELKDVFKNVQGIICLTAIVSGYILTGAVYGTIIAAVISLLFVIINKKTK